MTNFRNVMKSIQTRLKKKFGKDSNVRIFINYKKDDGTKGIYSTTFFKMTDYKKQIEDIINKFCTFYECHFNCESIEITIGENNNLYGSRF